MDLSLLTTEIVTVALACFVVALDLLMPAGEPRRALGYLTLLGLAGIFVHAFTQYGLNASLYGGMFRVDDYAVFFKQVFLAAYMLTILFSVRTADGFAPYTGEFYGLMLFSLAGMMVMASANDLVTLFVGMELMTITFFVLVGFNLGDGKSSEAGVKYLILGAASTAVLLYGMSLIYGYTGTVVLPEIAARLSASPAALVGIVFFLAGFAFKIAAVPFGMWVPDVYEGAPVPITALLAMASKAASFAVLTRVFLTAFADAPYNWPLIIAWLAAASMIAGNLAAILQTNVKRLLAYSSIAQAGYLLTGLVAAGPDGVKGIIFYTALYVFASAGAFAVVAAVRDETGSDDIAAYRGLARSSPLLAAAMTVALLSMAGIPPLAGFVGKLYLFLAVLEKGWFWLALLGFVMSMVSVYYYLLVVKAMYLGEPAGAPTADGCAALRWAALASLALTVLCGVYPTPLAALASRVAQNFFQ